MSILNWGLLPKSQVDEETIEEAIDRLITAHNEDETAHLGTGQALQSHKASEIIDHVAGSVVSDKLGSREISKHFIFESADPWQYTGSFAIVYGNGAQCGVEYGVSDHEYFFSSLSIPSNWFTITKDITYQTNLVLSDDNANLNFKFGFGGSSDGDVNSIGFVLSGGVFKARIVRGSSETLSSAITCDLTVIHTYRFIYTSNDRKVTFYIDGVNVAELTYPDDDPATDASVYFDLEQVDTGESYVTCLDVLIAREI